MLKTLLMLIDKGLRKSPFRKGGIGGDLRGPMIRIRFHGRGGQGMKKARRIAGTAASMEGNYVQDFPLYGAERRGAPLTAYTRISDKTIIVINTQGSPDATEKLSIRGRLALIDATGISLSVIGRDTAISAAMGAAACRAAGVIKKESLIEAVTRELTSIGISSEDVLKRNIEVAGKCFDSF